MSSVLNIREIEKGPLLHLPPSGFVLVGDEDHLVLFDGGDDLQRARHRLPHPQREGAAAAAAAAPAAEEEEEVEHIAGERERHGLIDVPDSTRDHFLVKSRWDNPVNVLSTFALVPMSLHAPRYDMPCRQICCSPNPPHRS